MLFATTFAALALLFAPSANAFPTAPGSCNSPQPFGNAHLRVGNGGFIGGTSLSSFDMEVLIDGVALVEGAVTDLPLNTELPIELRATGTPFRGFIFKLNRDGFDTRDMLSSTETNVRNNFNLCETLQAGAITHNENSQKSSVTGTIMIDGTEDITEGMLLEVTVAIQNGAVSEWYQTIFSVTASGAAVVATTAVPDTTTPAVTTAAATTTTTTTSSFTTIGFDDWFDSLADRFVGTRLRRCVRRTGTPPVVGVSCARRPKTCFFGNQQCPTGEIYPVTRCFCNGDVWSCGPSACPATPASTFN